MNWRNRIVLVIVGLLGLFSLYKIFNTSFVSVTVEGTDSGSYSFSAIDKKGRVRKTVTVDSDYARLRLPRGSYQIIAQHKNKSYFSVVDTKSFLRTSALTVKLTAESSRRFVGNNPLACQHYFKQVLVSYSCGGLDADIKVHVPATASTPTYTLAADLQLSGYVQGFVNTSQGSVGLINVPIGKDEGQAQNYYHLILFNDHFKVVRQRILSELDSRKFYSIQPYGRGFMIYDTGLATALTFNNFQADAKAFKLAPSEVKGVAPLQLDIYKTDRLSEYYAGNSLKAASEVIYLNGSRASHWRLPKSYQKVLVCDTNAVCALTVDHFLDVYDAAQSKPKLSYRLGGIKDIANTWQGFVMINRLGVVKYQAAARSGYLAYSFGGYTFNDLQPSGNSLLVTVVGRDGASTLAIDQTPVGDKAIDKQILALRSDTNVSNISAYGNHLFITANSGPQVYLPAINGYGPDPVVKRAAVKAVQSAIDRLGINREHYTIQVY